MTHPISSSFRDSRLAVAAVELVKHFGDNKAVNGVNLRIDRGEIVGVVGESGAGKSMTALSIVQMLPSAARIAGGSVMLDGVDLTRADARTLRKVRGGEIGMVFQDPLSSLNPLMSVGAQIAEAFRKYIHDAVETNKPYDKFVKAVKVPVLANITEFGQTPLYTRDELASVGVDIVLYCCSAYRAMNAAALKTYEAIRRDGTQKGVLDTMQTRADLYKYLDYHRYENKLDELFGKK